jgi:hypothetical protein
MKSTKVLETPLIMLKTPPSKPQILLKLRRPHLDGAAPEYGKQVLEWQRQSKMLHQ